MGVGMISALADETQLLATVGLKRMRVRLGGQLVTAWQLGAVGTLPELRGRGLQRQLMTHVLNHVGDDLTFLFANPRVLDFYPRFGFRRVQQSTFVADVHVTPSNVSLRLLHVHDATDRMLLQQLSARAQPVTERFGAQDHSTLLWYLCNIPELTLRYDARAEALFVTQQTQSVLYVHDILSANDLDLMQLLPALITEPITRVEFGFTPDRYSLATVRPSSDAGESPLFVRSALPFPAEPFKFPVLAQT